MKSVAILNGKIENEKMELNSIVRSKLANEGVRCLVTRFPGHAKDLAEKEKKTREIIVVGGDGTLHEVLSSLKSPFPRIRLLPAGTGNSLARDMGWEKWDFIQKSNPKILKEKVDLLQIDITTKKGKIRCYSASTIALGFPAIVTKIANRRFKKLKSFCYPVAAGLGVFFQKRKSYLVGYNGSTPKKVFMTGCILNNTRHVANFLAFPNASIKDGLLDVLELDAGIIRQTIHNISVLSKKYFYEPKPSFSASSVFIEFETPDILMIDGEIYENVIHFSVRNLSQILEIHGPR